MVTRWGRRKVLAPVVKGVRSSATNLRKVAKSPVKLTHAVRRLADDDARLRLRVRRRRWRRSAGGLSVPKIGAVFLGASALAAAAPTPGGLGAIEAALVAGLTGVGMASGPAVSTVLTYRLVTYWLPGAPGMARVEHHAAAE